MGLHLPWSGTGSPNNFYGATGYRAVIGLETDQLFGVAQLIGLVSGRDRASFGLLFGFQLGFASEPALGQEADRAAQLPVQT
jgi:hypothetical protein